MTDYKLEIISALTNEEKETAVEYFINDLKSFKEEPWSETIVRELNEVALENGYDDYETMLNDDLLSEFDCLCDAYLDYFFDNIEEVYNENYEC